MQKSRIFEVYELQKGRKTQIYTKSLVPGYNVYGEDVFRHGKDEYREWDPRRSKIAAYIMKGGQNIFMRSGQVVLYLGASTGTTVSHVSDIVGEEGFVFAVEFAPRVARELVFMCERRKNIAPIVDNANHPENYKDQVMPGVDIVFQDIAQKNQVQIFLKNMDAFLKKGGYGLLAIKSRSIDVTKKPKDIFRRVKAELEQAGLTIIDFRELGPFEMDHAMFVVKGK